MSELSEYIIAHSKRGSCTCGRCIDAPDKSSQPEGHTADVFFFEVADDGGDADELRRLTAAHTGEFLQMNPLDGLEHSFLAIGAWIGDQGCALMFMGLGTLLGIFELKTPKLLPVPEELQQQMAGRGLIVVKAKEQSDG